MTKQDPDKLCKSCYEFDQMMNNQGEGDTRNSLDVYVQCDHDEEGGEYFIESDSTPEPAKPLVFEKIEVVFDGKEWRLATTEDKDLPMAPF